VFKHTVSAGAIVVGLLAAYPAAAQWNQFGNSRNSPQIYAPDGTYLGDLNRNQFDPNSVANPFGPHGSPFAPNSITNPYTYGSPYGVPSGGAGGGRHR
jgi:hypothetical protein